MRVIVMFDLPTETLENKKEYREFRNFLIRDGFIMMQESIYTKLALNQTIEKGIRKRVKKHKPKCGLVQMLSITEKQFSSMEYVVGENISDKLDTDERVTYL